MTLHVKINTVPTLNCKNFKISLRNIPFKNKIGQNMFFGLNLGVSKYLSKNICFFQQVYLNNFIKLCIAS